MDHSNLPSDSRVTAIEGKDAVRVEKLCEQLETMETKLLNKDDIL